MGVFFGQIMLIPYFRWVACNTIPSHPGEQPPMYLLMVAAVGALATAGTAYAIETASYLRQTSFKHVLLAAAVGEGLALWAFEPSEEEGGFPGVLWPTLLTMLACHHYAQYRTDFKRRRSGCCQRLFIYTTCVSAFWACMIVGLYFNATIPNKVGGS